MIKRYFNNKLTTLRAGIINAMADTLWISLYADFWENPDSGVPERVKEKWPHAGAGQDWMYHSPNTSKSAYDLAVLLAKRLEALNNKSLEELIDDAAIADGLRGEAYDSEYVQSFGHYLAMEAVGHGVSWFDDHKKFPIRIPRGEVYAYTNNGKLSGLQLEGYFGRSGD